MWNLTQRGMGLRIRIKGHCRVLVGLVERIGYFCTRLLGLCIAGCLFGSAILFLEAKKKVNKWQQRLKQ